jgi:hypothetical protein
MIKYRFRVPSAVVFTLYSYSKALEYPPEYPTAGTLNQHLLSARNILFIRTKNWKGKALSLDGKFLAHRNKYLAQRQQEITQMLDGYTVRSPQVGCEIAQSADHQNYSTILH